MKIKSPWISTKSDKPINDGRIIIWYDNGAHEAFVTDVMVECHTLEMTWDLSADGEDELFEAWFYLSSPF